MQNDRKRLLFPHVLLLVYLCIIFFVPVQRPTARGSGSLLVAVAVMEMIFCIQYFRAKTDARRQGATDIMSFVWLLLIIWELATTKYNVAHPVLVPCPENVFDTFREQYRIIFLNIAYSMQILFIGFFSGLILAIFMGLVAGWIPRVRNFAYPIANVMAPIPAVVFSPYLVAIMPTFRSASVVVIALGIFWPTFMTTVNRIAGMPGQILDNARMMHLNDFDMISRVLFPYIMPGVISGLRVSMTTCMLALNFAELMGASHGLGYYIQNSITYANYTHAVAGIITTGIVVTILSCLVKLVQDRLIIWR